MSIKRARAYTGSATSSGVVEEAEGSWGSAQKFKTVKTLSTLPAFYALFDSYKGNVNILGAPNSGIINITCVLSTFLLPTKEHDQF